MGCGCGKSNAKIGIMGQIKSASKAVASIAGGTAWRVSEEEYMERLSRCEQCDNMNTHSKRCNVCGCFVAIKARYKGEAFHCPENQW